MSTFSANERFLACVPATLVLQQVNFVQIGFPTRVTSEGSFLRMRSHMNGEVTLAQESFIALLAGNFAGLFPTQVLPKVLRKIALTFETFLTQLTLVGSFPGMNSQMDIQLSAVVEAFFTTLEGTSISALLRVNYHVRL